MSDILIGIILTSCGMGLIASFYYALSGDYARATYDLLISIVCFLFAIWIVNNETQNAEAKEGDGE